MTLFKVHISTLSFQNTCSVILVYCYTPLFVSTESRHGPCQPRQPQCGRKSAQKVGGNLLKMWEEICLKCGRKSARQQSRNLETAATPLRLALASEKVFGPCSLYSGIEGWKKTLKSASSLFSNCLVSWTFCFVSETFSLFSFSSLFGTSASNSGSRRPSTSHDANRPKLLVYFFIFVVALALTAFKLVVQSIWKSCVTCSAQSQPNRTDLKLFPNLFSSNNEVFTQGQLGDLVSPSGVGKPPPACVEGLPLVTMCTALKSFFIIFDNILTF